MLVGSSNGATAVRATTQATSAIPFRSEPAISTDRLAIAGLTIALLLGAICAAFYVAKRRGWLAGALPPGAKRSDRVDGLAIQASKRVSVSSTVHVLTFGDREFLVVESTRGVTAQICTLDKVARDTGSAS